MYGTSVRDRGGAGAHNVSVGDVTAWLRANGFGATAVELYAEMERCTGVRHGPLLEVAASVQRRLAPSTSYGSADSEASAASSACSASVVSTSEGGSPTTPLPSTSVDLSRALEQCVSAFVKIRGEEAAVQALTAAGAIAINESLSSSSQPTAAEDRAGEELVELARRAREAESQLRQLTALVSTSLTHLIDAVDPARRDALLPLLRSVAILGESAAARAAARHAMLNLYKRPTEETRRAIAAEWVKVSQKVPWRSVEQEVVPELYGLVNARTAERRQLALDCALAVAPQLRHAHKVRHSLCQGLLRPLSEDESSTVRRAVPACLAALWGGPQAGHEAESATDAEPLPGDAPLSAQSTFPMELAIRMCLDAGSNPVRHAAQEQLRELILPQCCRDKVVLSTFVPLLMTFISVEVAPLRAESITAHSSGAEHGGSSSRQHSASDGWGVPAAPPLTLLPRALGAGRGAAAPAASTRAGKGSASPTALAYANLVMLAKLCNDAVRCVRLALGGLRRSSADLPLSAAGVAPTVQAFEKAADEVCDVFLRVVLPTVYSLIPPLLGAFSTGEATRRSVCGSLCSLVAALAALIPALNQRSWQRIRGVLEASIADGGGHPPPFEHNRHGACAEDAETQRQAMRGRLLFYYVVLIRLAGEQAAFQSPRVPTPPPQGGSTTGGSPSDEPPSADLAGREGAALVRRSLDAKGIPFTTDERMAVLALALGLLGGVSSSSEKDRVSAGVVAVLWSFTESEAATRRLHAVRLVTQICAQPLPDAVKVSCVCPPLLVLLNDPEAAVQEMAVKGQLSVAATLSTQAAQEKVLRPALAIVEASGCTSRLTAAVLHQWESLLPTMAAEPREMFLYPQLNILMDRLSVQSARRVMTAHLRRSATSTPKHGGPSSSIPFSPEEQEEQEHWEKVVQGVITLLMALLRCAVVTPTLVTKHLMPGIHCLAGEGVFDGCSTPHLRNTWLHVEKSYVSFIENNSTFAVTQQQATNFLNKFRDELKRRF